MDSLASQDEAPSPLVAWSYGTHTCCSLGGQIVSKVGKVCQRGWSCLLAHCFTDGESKARRRWGLPMGPSRLVAEAVQGSRSSDLHSMLFLYLAHPLPPSSLEVISSGHQQVQVLGTHKGKMASAVIRGFSEEGRDQDSQQVPVILCTALLPGTSGT